MSHGGNGDAVEGIHWYQDNLALLDAEKQSLKIDLAALRDDIGKPVSNQQKQLPIKTRQWISNKR